MNIHEYKGEIDPRKELQDIDYLVRTYEELRTDFKKLYQQYVGLHRKHKKAVAEAERIRQRQLRNESDSQKQSRILHQEEHAIDDIAESVRQAATTIRFHVEELRQQRKKLLKSQKK